MSNVERVDVVEPGGVMSGVARSGMLARLAFGAAVLVAAPVLVACTGGDVDVPQPSASSSPGTSEPLDYEAALRAVPMEGVPRAPLIWSGHESLTPAETEAVEVVRRWEAVNHMLGFAEVPRQDEDIALLYLVAVDERADPIADYHRWVVEPHPDPHVGPRWIKLLDVDLDAEPVTVTLCFDEGFYGRVSEGGGREMLREHRALLVVYSLVRAPVPGAGQRWKVAHERPYAGDDYPEPDTGPDRECKEWADHELSDAP